MSQPEFPLVSCIIVHFGDLTHTQALLDNISVSDYPHVEWIVVDNGSEIDVCPQITKTYPFVHTIRSEQNLGFAGGNNLGIQAAQGECLFFINNDTLLTAPLIDQLVTFLREHPAAGVVCPKILFEHDRKTLQFVGFTPIHPLTVRNQMIGEGEPDMGQYTTPAETPYAFGAAMMVRREVIEKVGGLPEAYFLYYEELDWSVQIRRAGYQIWVEPTATIYHKGSASVGAGSAFQAYYYHRNRLLFVRRTVKGWKRWAAIIYLVLVAAPKSAFVYLLGRKWEHLKRLRQAMAWHIRSQKSPLFPT